MPKPTGAALTALALLLVIAVATPGATAWYQPDVRKPSGYGDGYSAICQCPSGISYWVSDHWNGCGSVACYGGTVTTACSSVYDKYAGGLGVWCGAWVAPTAFPTKYPTEYPTKYPTEYPTKYPSTSPTTTSPTTSPTTTSPTTSPTLGPTASPTLSPTPGPTQFPTSRPSVSPTPSPTYNTAAIDEARANFTAVLAKVNASSASAPIVAVKSDATAVKKELEAAFAAYKILVREHVKVLLADKQFTEYDAKKVLGRFQADQTLFGDAKTQIRVLRKKVQA